MRLSDSNTVDYLGLEKESGTVVATLIDDCDWADELQHLSLLQAKINRYLDFIESGEVFEELARKTGRVVPKTTLVKISILAKHEPTGEGPEFLKHVEKVAQEFGVDVTFKVLRSTT